jgi:hypothetical protein
MNPKMKIAFWLYLPAIFLFGLSGVVYLLRTEFMPYHAVAVGMAWADVDPSFQILLLGGIRILGAALISTATAMGIILFIPFRQGMAWARWCIPLLGLIAGLPALYVTISVTVKTPATAPWIGIVVFIALMCAGFAMSFRADRTRPKAG